MGLSVLLILKTHNVLMPLRSRFQQQAVFAHAVVSLADPHLAVFVVLAREPFRGGCRATNRGIALAGNHVTVPAQSLLIESGHLFPGIGGGIGNRPYA